MTLASRRGSGMVAKAAMRLLGVTDTAGDGSEGVVDCIARSLGLVGFDSHHSLQGAFLVSSSLAHRPYETATAHRVTLVAESTAPPERGPVSCPAAPPLRRRR